MKETKHPSGSCRSKPLPTDLSKLKRTRSHYAIALHREEADLKKAIDAALQAMRHEGVLVAGYEKRFDEIGL